MTDDETTATERAEIAAVLESLTADDRRRMIEHARARRTHLEGTWEDRGVYAVGAVVASGEFDVGVVDIINEKIKSYLSSGE